MPAKLIYKQSPLPRPQPGQSYRPFRLLEIRHTEDPSSPLHGSLGTFNLDDGKSFTSYKALSYVCGDPDITEPMYIDGQQFDITSNCHAAICRLRELGACRVWVDSVCIQQNDTEEKSFQVSMMSQIYSKAEEVIVFLGYNKQEVQHTQKESDNFVTGLIMMKNAINGNSSARLSKPRIDGKGPRLVPGEWRRQYRALAQFFFHPWFSRVWTYRETTFSKSIRVVTNHTTVPYSLLLPTINDLIDKIEALNRDGRKHLILEKSELEQLSRARCHTAAAASLQSIERKPKLHEWMLRICFYDCSHPLDRVFAALGFQEDYIRNMVQVDYSKSVLEVYFNAAEVIMQTENSLRLIRFAGLANTSEMEWPSWLPDWQKNRKDVPVPIPSASYKDPLIEGINIPRSLREWLKLEVQVIFIDSVLAKMGPFDNVEDLSRRQSEFKEWKLWKKHFEDLSEYNFSWGWIRTITMNIDHGQTELQGQQDCDRQPGQALVKYWALWAYRENEVAGAEFYRKAFPRAKKTQSRWKRWILQTKEEFTRGVSESCIKRNFFITKKRSMGLGPECLEDGDMVCLIKGINVPMLLRWVRGNTYKLVGESFVLGLMDGEVFEDKDGKYRERKRDTIQLI